MGGEETFRRLVHRFYQGVAEDPVLRPVYPAKDLGLAEEHLRLFLMQYWGGPQNLQRAARAPAGCGCATRGSRSARPSGTPGCITCGWRWTTSGWTRLLDAQLWDYLVMAARSLVNVDPTLGPGELGLSQA